MVMAFLDYLLSPLLGIPQLAAILLISFSISLVMTLVYKWMTDQALMRTLKDDLKKYQQLMKETKDTDKMMELQKKAMNANMQYLMSSLKPTLITMLPILLVFGWLSAHFAYAPLLPNQEFTLTAYAPNGVTGNIILEVPEEITVDQTEKSLVDNKAVWNIKGESGNFLLTLKTNGKEYDKDVIISTEQRYASPEKEIGDGVIDKLVVSMKDLTLLNLFGWELGWLGTYILSSLLFSLLLRKVLNIY